MALKTCRVSCVNFQGVEHAVEVSAGSLYEAVAQALRIFRDNEWIEDIGAWSDAALCQGKTTRGRAYCARTGFRAVAGSNSTLTCRDDLEKPLAGAGREGPLICVDDSP